MSYVKVLGQEILSYGLVFSQIKEIYEFKCIAISKIVAKMFTLNIRVGIHNIFYLQFLSSTTQCTLKTRFDTLRSTICGTRNVKLHKC